MPGYSEKLTVKVSDSSTMSFFNRLANTFLFGSSFMYYNRYSKIVYEGDRLNVFGVLSYNRLLDSWEMTKPLAFIKSGYLGQYITSLTWEQVYSGFGFVIRGGLAFLCTLGLIWAGKRLLSRLRNTIINIYNERFRQQDEAHQIENAPPI